jgi:lipoprotein-anchoring transpeptidase ErfK/SrfK
MLGITLIEQPDPTCRRERRRGSPSRVRALTAAIIGGLVFVGAGSAVATAKTAKVVFLTGEQTTAVQRPDSTLTGALRSLMAGPTAPESRRGLTSQIPRGTRLRGVRLVHGVATVDLGARIAQGSDPESMSARVAQLVLTATAVPGVKSVQLLVDGRPSARLSRLSVARPLTATDVRAPSLPPPGEPPEPKQFPPDDSTFELQTQLSELGYLDPAGVTGRPGEQTAFAVVAFQKWEGLQRDGIAGPATLAALATAVRPTPITVGPGLRVEVLLDRQLALVIRDGVVMRTLPVSTGKPGYETLPGTWKIQRKYLRDWSVPYRTWLPYASYFVGGYAFHEYPEVPPTPASHGCVRTTRYDIKWLYDRTPVGTPVTVLKASA